MDGHGWRPDVTPSRGIFCRLDIARPAMRPLTPEEREAIRKACGLTIARHEQALISYRAMEEIALVTRVMIEHSRDLMAWVDAVLKGRV
jgi:hypothetical protein